MLYVLKSLNQLLILIFILSHVKFLILHVIFHISSISTIFDEIKIFSSIKEFKRGYTVWMRGLFHSFVK